MTAPTPAWIIAATVAGIPDSLGGKRMAIRVAELARAALAKQLFNGVRLFLVAHQMAQPKPARQPKGEPDIITLPGQAE